MKLLIFLTVFNAFFSRIATSFHLPPSRAVPNVQKRIRLPDSLIFPLTERKTRDFALQSLSPSNQSMFQKLDPNGAHFAYLIISYIAATFAIQNDPSAGDINNIVLKAACIFWIATSLFLYDACYLLVGGLMLGKGFFVKFYYVGLVALTLSLTLLGVASPVIVATVKLEAIEFIWNRLSALWKKKKQY
ncbi:predicted protein [Chaetoceros tenuissimus]|uniref:Uncharacterized protein n=1 Tax=Chaetoceros tenuissimus TaxID=426638 RepID=A0AAD3D2F9_9STRA|nr:predicted protein [Chaetoceros tenuissimus]